MLNCGKLSQDNKIPNFFVEPLQTLYKTFIKPQWNFRRTSWELSKLSPILLSINEITRILKWSTQAISFNSWQLWQCVAAPFVLQLVDRTSDFLETLESGDYFARKAVFLFLSISFDEYLAVFLYLPNKVSSFKMSSCGYSCIYVMPNIYTNCYVFIFLNIQCRAVEIYSKGHSQIQLNLCRKGSISFRCFIQWILRGFLHYQTNTSKCRLLSIPVYQDAFKIPMYFASLNIQRPAVKISSYNTTKWQNLHILVQRKIINYLTFTIWWRRIKIH